MDRYKYHIYMGLVSFFLFLLRFRLLQIVLSNSVSVTPEMAIERPGVGDYFDGIIRSGSTGARHY
jgi:FMN phosphatase YigB (HAD superfamily)